MSIIIYLSKLIAVISTNIKISTNLIIKKKLFINDYYISFELLLIKFSNSKFIINLIKIFFGYTNYEYS